MSIHEYNKDQLKWHAEVELATSKTSTLPDHRDLLKFWTHHETKNTLIDLTVFAQGELERPASGRWVGKFTGRPQLIRQLAPAIEASVMGTSKATADNYVTHLRYWWRLLDTVEMEAKQAGQHVERVEDVRQITRVHYEFAHRSGMRSVMFRTFLRLANVTLQDLGSSRLHWDAPEDPKSQRHLPPEDQIKAIRLGLKQAWSAVTRRWILMDRIRSDGFEPQTEEEADLLKHWRYFSDKQRTSNTLLPTSHQLLGGINDKYFTRVTGLSLKALRATTFPTHWEADTAFHLCLANTGWNLATLYDLNPERPFLHTHPKDVNRYLITGETYTMVSSKARSGGKEQIVSGLWKTTSGPGFIIKEWLNRTEPLRERLKEMLGFEWEMYEKMIRGGASADVLTRQFMEVQRLEAGSRSVWLYVNGSGHIEWLRETNILSRKINGKYTRYLPALIDQINNKRTARGEAPIAPVTASDFRDIFALYVWRQSGGNILAVMRVLNHAHLRTTQGYVDNNILNTERDRDARTFLENLFAELGVGRMDITILAHLQRHGVVLPEAMARLTFFRTLQRSRLGVACRDPFHPPSNIQPEANGRQICGLHRCLLCKSHAVILPESMPGIAMRVEELKTIQASVPVDVWFNSEFPNELSNGLDVLSLFAPNDVRQECERWAQAIASKSHHIPGLHLGGPKSERCEA
jgi:hypothetical protein